MRVHIHETRRDQSAPRIDLFGAFGEILANAGNPAADDGDIGFGMVRRQSRL